MLREQKNENNALILFGAGVYAKKYKSLLDFLDMPFDYFTDNDSGKWGTELYGKKVIPPATLVNMECSIIISCTHGEQITKQLEDIGLKHNLIDMEMLYQKFANVLKQRDMINTKRVADHQTVILDIYEGIGWGGTEIWALTVGYGLYDQGRDVIFFGSTEQEPIDRKYEKLTKRFEQEHTLEKMITEMLNHLPFVLINNFAGCAYLAAVLLKMQFPQEVEIIDVIHNDNVSLFNAHMIFSKWVDAYICVSRKIREEVLSRYTVEKNKVYFKEQPIDVEVQFTKVFSPNNEPLRVGYAARIVKQQKRTDLFPDLIAELENKHVNYVLTIAGEGECLEKIRSYIKREHLSGRILTLGRIPKSDMSSFWKEQDVFLNFSEYEGTSLSMLEAMSYACVPVVTDVSGVREFITNRTNGFYSPVGNLENLATNLKELDADRNKLSLYGLRSRELILQKCRKADYIEYLLNVLGR